MNVRLLMVYFQNILLRDVSSYYTKFHKEGAKIQKQYYGVQRCVRHRIKLTCNHKCTGVYSSRIFAPSL